MSTSVDCGESLDECIRFRPHLPERFLAQLARWGVRLAGRRALDLGTGPGQLALELSRRGARVVGLDPSQEALRAAHVASELRAVPPRFVRAVAEWLPLASGSVHVVTAAQSWWWFEADVAAREALRVLRPGGALILVSFDWLPRPGTLAAATEELIQRFHPGWPLGGGKSVYPEWLDELGAAGFENLESVSFESPVPFTHLGWRGRVRASAGVGRSLGTERVQSFDSALAEMLRGKFPTEPLEVVHRLYAVIGRRPTWPRR